MSSPFPDPPALCGPLRRPRQMLADQRYDGHKSIHDDAMAERLGLRAGPIEGPTHFSQFDPLLYSLWGQAWFETGCLSAHYQTMVIEGEEVRAFVQPAEPGRLARIWAEKRDGTPVLTGTASVGPGADGEPTEIAQRIAKLRPSGPLVLYRDLRVGQNAAAVERVRMGFDQHMGDSYPFTLADKLAVITEPCRWYTRDGGAGSPWGRPILPREMISVLLSSSSPPDLRARGPAVGLFAGQEIRLIRGPLFVDQTYELEREVIALSESPRTESAWIRTRVRDAGTGALVAEMILNHAVMKASYAAYDREAAELGRAR
ncbi:MAG TPA: hypothetical protein VHW23_00295 [Kofleriaceae bacterium]|nr:hypothetical protein [Kofleriaceae bacterium]